MNDLFIMVGVRIAQHRILLNLSQEELAELAHVSRNFVGYTQLIDSAQVVNANFDNNDEEQYNNWLEARNG